MSEHSPLLDSDEFGQRHVEAVTILDSLRKQLRGLVDSGVPAEQAVTMLARGAADAYSSAELAELLAFAVGHSGE